MFVLEKLIDVIAPHNCLSCDAEGSVLCPNCKKTAPKPIPSRCYICRAQTDEFKVCERCRHKSHLQHVWVASDYGGMAKRLVQLYKFERGQSAAAIIANFMAQ